MATIPLITQPVSADRIQSALNMLIDQINLFLGGLSPESVDITGGTIDGTVIGGITPAAGTFTSLAASSGAIGGDTIATLTAIQTLSNKLLTSPAITGGTINGAVIGGVTPSAITGTTITANTGFTGALTGNVTGNLSGNVTGNLTGNVTGNVSGSSGSTTGNAATATALQTPRAINGVNFDGTAPITVAAAAGTLTGTALASNVVSSSLTSVGTLAALTVTATITGSVSGSAGSVAAASITGTTLASNVVTSSLTTVGTIASGTWQGSTVAGQYGGTGVNNTGKTITLGGNLSLSGAFGTTLTVTGTTALTLPTSGTVTALGNSVTGSGNIVLATSPTLVTPTIGAASATSLSFSSTSGIIGTMTNNAAAAGSVGELISSSILVGSGMALTSGVSANLTSLSLSAGDWDVYFNVYITGNNATIAQYLVGSISNTTGVLDTTVGRYISNSYGNVAIFTFTNPFTAPIQPYRISLAGTTTIYCVVNAGFSVSTLSAYGYFAARRVR